jgi:hydroxypyruvate reductase
VIARDVATAVLRDALAACDPARRVADALATPAIAQRIGGRELVGVAMGKCALAMARGAGPVARGIAVAPVDDGKGLPAGWRLMVAAHPEPDERSLAAGEAVLELVRGAKRVEVLLALVSGGASALVENPLPPIELAELRALVNAVVAAGAPIREINAVRSALSAIKAGRLARASAAPIVTLAASDVIGDDLAVIASGATVGSWLGAGGQADLTVELAARRARARAIVERYQVDVPPSIDEVLEAPRDSAPQVVARADLAQVVAPIKSFAEAAHAALASRGIATSLRDAPLTEDVVEVARLLAGTAGAVVAWGEPTVRVPRGAGEGGRAQQLALLLARHLRKGDRAALVVGSDGIDGPPPRHRPSPAGAYVDGTTWDRIPDADAVLARCDAGSALAALDALVVTGPTGVNHADLVIVG